MKKKILIIIGVIAVIVIGSVLYFDNNGKQKNEIKVGVILPLTGPSSDIGNNILDGIKISADYYNKSSSSKIKLIIEDSKLDAKQAISAANKLIEVDKVVSIIGLASSTEALSVAPICERNKILMISATASTPKLTDAGDYIFRIYPSDVYDGKTLADFSKKHKYKTVSILYLNNDFGVGLKNVFIKDYIKSGGKIGVSEPFLSDDIDFRTQLTKIKNNHSDGLLVIAIDMQYLNIIKQIRELRIQSQIMAPVTFDNSAIIKNLGEAANGIVYTRPEYNTSMKSPDNLYFKKKYRELKGTEPSLLTALGFDNLSSFYIAFKKSNSCIDKTKALLYKMNFNGVSGRIKFDKNGDIIPEIEVRVVTNKKSVLYEKK